MAPAGTLRSIDYGSLADVELAARVRRGDREAFRQIMQRCNQRVFRMARSVVGNDAEAEDVVQEAYLHAFEHIATIRGESSLTTWLTRIVLNGAQSRLRQRRSRLARRDGENTPASRPAPAARGVERHPGGLAYRCVPVPGITLRTDDRAGHGHARGRAIARPSIHRLKRTTPC